MRVLTKLYIVYILCIAQTDKVQVLVLVEDSQLALDGWPALVYADLRHFKLGKRQIWENDFLSNLSIALLIRVYISRKGATKNLNRKEAKKKN